MATSPHRRDLLKVALAALAAAPAKAVPLKLPGPVRIGLIGVDGHYGEATKAARFQPEIRIVAYEANTEREKSRASNARELAGAKVYGDYRKLLDETKPDVAVICDQNHRRAESVAACLERGIPTAAEKPIATSMADLRRLEELRERTSTPLTMLLPMRFNAEFLAMKAIVDSGAIGETAVLSGQKSYQLGERPDWMTRRETFGGTIPYIACHTVDLLRFISGREFVETAAFHGRVGFPQVGEMENACAVSYRLDNGGVAEVRLDYLRPQAASSHGDDRIRVAGTQGVVEYQGGQVTLITDDEAPHEVVERPATRPLLIDFLDAVYNKARHSIAAADLFQVSRIVLRSREAADAGRVLAV